MVHNVLPREQNVVNFVVNHEDLYVLAIIFLDLYMYTYYQLPDQDH